MIVYGVRGDWEGPIEYRYVGATTQFPKYRWKTHLKQALEGNSQLPVHRWIRKCEGRVTFDILERCESIADLVEAEIRLIATMRLNGHRLLNIRDGGDGLHATPEAVCEAIREEYAKVAPGNTMKKIAERHGLSTTTVKLILNNTPGGRPERRRAGSPRLHFEDVVRIKEMLTRGISHVEIAAMYGVTRECITGINRGKAWNDVPWPEGFSKGVRFKQVGENGSFSKLTESDVAEIKSMLRDGIAEHKIGKMFGVSQAHVNRIRHGVSWGWVQ